MTVADTWSTSRLGSPRLSTAGVEFVTVLAKGLKLSGLTRWKLWKVFYSKARSEKNFCFRIFSGGSLTGRFALPRFHSQPTAAGLDKRVIDPLEFLLAPGRIFMMAQWDIDDGSRPRPRQKHPICVEPKSPFLLIAQNLPARRPHLSWRPPILLPNQVASPTEADVVEL